MVSKKQLKEQISILTNLISNLKSTNEKLEKELTQTKEKVDYLWNKDKYREENDEVKSLIDEWMNGTNKGSEQ